MTEVTRVPLQPIAKGSLTKLWLGVIIAILIGAGVAWAAVPTGIDLETVTAGSGPHPSEGDMLFVEYTGKLDDGTVFDKSQPLPPQVASLFPQGTPMPFEKGQTIEGFQQGLARMQKGGHYILKIPSNLAYGATPPKGAPIPPNANLTFDMTVTDIMSKDEFQKRVAVIQQMMQQGGAGGPGGPNPSAPQ